MRSWKSNIRLYNARRTLEMNNPPPELFSIKSPQVDEKGLRDFLETMVVEIRALKREVEKLKENK